MRIPYILFFSAMQVSNIHFKPLEYSDLKQLLFWHNQPHVKEWYEKNTDLSTETLIEDEYRTIIEKNDPTQAFIIYIEEIPIGYIQTYYIQDNPEYAEAVQVSKNTAGLDIFIGDSAYIHKGFGVKILKIFLKKIVFLDKNIQNCIVGPEPKNKSAITAYQKAGFRYIKTVTVPGETEPEYLMMIERKKVVTTTTKT